MVEAASTTVDEQGWSFLRSSRWLGYYALIIVFSIVCVLLGNWQFDRRDQARAEIQRIDNNYDAPPVPLEDALPELQSYNEDANKWHPVRITGTYQDEPYLARNRPAQNSVGSLVIHPLTMPDGSVFYVDRGWVDVNATDSDAGEVSLPQPASGEVEVTVRLRESESPVDGRENVGRTLGSINLQNLAQQMGVTAYTGAYGQVVSETPSGETGLLAVKPERDEGPHLSYALQWYVFILIVIGGAWYAATLEYRSLNSGSTRIATKDAQKSERKRKRGLTDAEEEDALLDGSAV